MIKKLFACLLALQFFYFSNAQLVSLNDKEIVALKSLIQTDRSAAKQFASYQRWADSALNDTPNPIDTITTEGKLKGDPKKTATSLAIRDFRKMYALALCYKINGEQKYLVKAQDFLVAWAVRNHPKGDPIDDTNLDAVIECYDLIKNDIDSDKPVIQLWLHHIADEEIRTHKAGKETSMNNWNSHRLKIIGEVAYCLNDASYKAFIKNEMPIQLNGNLNADGSSWDFHQRDALHYHVYDLLPLIKLSIILKRAEGIDYYNYQTPQQASIAKSVAFLVPFVTGAQKHQEFVNSKVPFDLARAKNGEKEYETGHLFDAMQGVPVLSIAAWFQSSLVDTMKKVKNNYSKFIDWQSVLNEVTKMN
jgi:hypothetical protein